MPSVFFQGVSIDMERPIFGLKKERYDELVEDYGKEYADKEEGKI